MPEANRDFYEKDGLFYDDAGCKLQAASCKL
jgi:hypothetical protein